MFSRPIVATPLINMQINCQPRAAPPSTLLPRNGLSLQTGNKMAAAGPSTRASSAAVATALGRRGRRGRCEEMAAAKTGVPGPASGPALLILPSPPPSRPEESGCAGCLETPGEAAALPCGHSLCRGCAQRAPDAAGPGCPPEQDARAAPAEPEFIFRAPIKLNKPGEHCEEYECLRKLREEKVQEEKTSEDQIHKLLPEDAETGKKKMDEQKKRDEPLVVKTNLEHCLARLSDSENEEPSQGQMTQPHRSAFVSKNNSYSIAFLAGKLNTKVQRSQSCSDTAQDRVKSRLRAVPTKKAKVTTMTPASNPIIGVLLSTQNNRCLSAPDLTIEKRLPFSSFSSLASLHKPERSISPESNDSISEELNHFKPIVCSPCTPPKRLPDGRVLSPLIIKSTPRNLNRSLQKQTSYEASPRILKKWEQIFQERQIKKTLSKATLTSLAPEAGEDLLSSEAIHPSKEKPLLALNTRLSSGQMLSEYTGPTPTDPEYFPSVSQTQVEQGKDSKKSTEVPLEISSSELKEGIRGTSLEGEQFDGPGSTPDTKLDKTCLSTAMKISAVNSVVPKSNVFGGILKTKKQLKTLNHFDLANGVLVDSLCEEPLPPLRRGQKRRCKTKHLEQNGSLKKLRQTSSEVGLAPTDPVLREMEQKLQQEEEDRQLALQLQRMFDNERRTVSRRKGSVDQYLLRSSSMAGAK
ncbi:E3 ubiquitin-protein ligase RNF169 [Octodon degus]|uniref:RING-type E3 ubiquitin transferase n=1 Tax=Octodon degus TaxID=10160 RepID=A0A6P6EK63_OCTDE|nr:E3 ubiquitin-protein ligase RNF169 [Octodon degus]